MAQEIIKIPLEIDDSGANKTLKDLRNETKGYKDQLVQLDRGSKEYNKTLAKLAESQGKINQLNRDVRNSTLNLTDVYRELSSVSAGLVAGFNAVTAVEALLGVENEALAETFVKLQAGMALVQSITSVSNGIKSLTSLLPKARLAVLAFNSALLANPAVAIAAAIVGLGTAVFAITSILSSNTEQVDKANKAYKEYNDIIEQLDKDTEYYIKTLQIQGASEQEILQARINKNEDVREASLDAIDSFIEQERHRVDILNNIDSYIDGTNDSALKAIGLRDKAVRESFKSVLKDYKQSLDNQQELADEDRLLELKEDEKQKKALQDARDKANKEAAAKQKKFRDDELKAQQDYNKLLEEIIISSNDRVNDALTGTKRLDYINEQIKLNDELIKSYVKLAKEATTEQDKLKALNNYNKALEDNIKLIDEQVSLTNELASTSIKVYEDEVNTLNIRKAAIQASLLDETTSLSDRNRLRKEYNDILIEEERLLDKINSVQTNIRIDSINSEIEANNNLILSLTELLSKTEEGSLERIALQNQINEAKRNEILLNDRLVEQQQVLVDEESLAVEQRIELQRRLDEARNGGEIDNRTDEEKLQDDINRLWELASNEEASYDERIDAINRYEKALIDLGKLQDTLAKEEEKIQKAKLKVTKDVLGASLQFMKENTASYKIIASTNAAINAYEAANASYKSLAGIPIVGPALGATAAAAALAYGFANVRSILRAGRNSGLEEPNDTVTALPNMPTMNTPIVETHNNLDSYDEDYFNQNTRVYVLESDITDTQRRVNVAENESTF